MTVPKCGKYYFHYVQFFKAICSTSDILIPWQGTSYDMINNGSGAKHHRDEKITTTSLLWRYHILVVIMTGRFSYPMHTNLPLPFEEIRKNPNNSWLTFKDTHKSICQLYHLCVTEILSETPLTLKQLIKFLRIKYSIPLHAAENFLNFISTIETNDIIFDEPLAGIRQPLIRLRNKDFSNIKPSGAYSVFLPHKR